MLRKPLLTTHEVAELVKVTEPTVRTWIREGQLRGIQISREWRVAFIDLEAFLEERATTTIGGVHSAEHSKKNETATSKKTNKRLKNLK